MSTPGQPIEYPHVGQRVVLTKPNGVHWRGVVWSEGFDPGTEEVVIRVRSLRRLEEEGWSDDTPSEGDRP